LTFNHTSDSLNRSPSYSFGYWQWNLAQIEEREFTDNVVELLVAESLREAIAVLAIPHECSDVSDLVTLSLGVDSQIPSLDGSPESLIAHADAALYSAKNRGRNRAIAYTFL
jgi:diguanylate cyclase (GGDEF)-like protein